jgi:hypothetical protein
MRKHNLLVLILLILGGVHPAAGLDHVTVRREGRTVKIEGRILETAQDGGLLVLGRDGVLWLVEPQDLVEKSKDQEPFEPLTADELARKLLAELPSGFDVFRTPHYLVLYDTSRGYAQFCGSLLERLYLAFTNFWSHKGFELQKPAFPLVAVVFAQRRSFAEYVRAQLGDAPAAMLAYFHLETNRITMYDLTGSEASGRPAERSALAVAHRILAQPDAERNVATIVHEATHQIAFNCGLHTRLSDCPMWFSEGIAVYFETPDLTSTKGWRTIGGVNPPRLARFQGYLGRRPADSLASLLADDKRFRDTGRALDAYAEAWALTYYLLRQRPKQYVAYLRLLSAKRALIWDDAGKRLDQFKDVFGDLERLDNEFVRFMSRVR